MPPSPLFQGSTAASANAVATAASTALPPARSISAPTAAAAALCETTRPCRETTVGFSTTQFWITRSIAFGPLRRERGAVVRRLQVDRRALRDDPGRIELFDRPVAEDVVARPHGRGDARHLIKLAHVIGEIRIVGDPLPVAFEQRKIRHIE